jgi:hypothetical protein
MRTRIAVTAITAALAALAVAVAVSAQKGPPPATPDDSFFAALAGKNERPRADRDGRGSFAGTIDGNQLCYGLSVKNIGDPVAAHIHRGRARRNGRIVITLTTPAGGDPDSVGDCVTVPLEIRRDMMRRTGSYYVNVHNQEFPNGAVRGQLFARTP